MSKLDILKTAVTSNIGRQLLKTQKHSPTILFAGGVVGVVATAVLASRATLKVGEVLDEYDHNKKLIDRVSNDPEFNGRYTDKDATKDHLYLKTQTAVKIAKLYAPAIVVGSVSIAALTGSHVILTRRNVALTAAYKAVEKAYDEYRQRVIAEVGEEKEREIRYGVETAEALDDEGRTSEVKVPRDGRASKYARYFDELNPNWRRTPMYNQMFLNTQLNWANDMLRSRGHLFLNEVYDMLGFERTKEGSVVGWLWNKDGDNYVDFGVFFNNNDWMSTRWVNGEERSILLDFNVDGLIYDKI